jgi:KipI family sensor histidine kinase inhibitor
VLLVGRDRAPGVEELSGWDADDREGRDRTRSVEIGVTYGGPDLETAAACCRLGPEELVRRHAAGTYTVAFIGFAPGFPYLIGGDPLVRPPRRDEPRTQVPAGTLAVAGEYTSIYPQPGPGGWQLIGHSDAPLFDPTREPPSLLEPGDTVRFVEAT